MTLDQLLLSVTQPHKMWMEEEKQLQGTAQVYIYQLKWVEFVPVITQNENGPQVGGVREGLSLLSHRTRTDCVHFWHCLLTNRMKLVARETIVTLTTLMDLLGTAIIENTPQESGDRANYEQNIQDAMASFQKGMSMFASTL